MALRAVQGLYPVILGPDLDASYLIMIYQGSNWAKLGGLISLGMGAKALSIFEAGELRRLALSRGPSKTLLTIEIQ
jgi:hypothetical protein